MAIVHPLQSIPVAKPLPMQPFVESPTYRLDTLPQDVLLMIEKYLPPPSSLALKLSNKQIYLNLKEPCETYKRMFHRPELSQEVRKHLFAHIPRWQREQLKLIKALEELSYHKAKEIAVRISLIVEDGFSKLNVQSLGKLLMSASSAGASDIVDKICRGSRFPLLGNASVLASWRKACRYGQKAVIQVFLDLRKEKIFYLKKESFETAFRQAVVSGHHEVVKALRDHPQFGSNTITTLKIATIVAAQKGDVLTLHELMQCRRFYKMPQTYLLTPLIRAIQYRRWGVVNMLMANPSYLEKLPSEIIQMVYFAWSIECLRIHAFIIMPILAE